MTPALAAILEVSTRIREYEAAADTITALARLATDVQVRAALQQQALELVQTAGQWRARQDAELSEAYAVAIIPLDADKGRAVGPEHSIGYADYTQKVKP